MNKYSPLGASLAFALVLPAASAPAAPVGTAFTYQGRLFDGTNPANGTYDLTFALFDAGASGNCVSSRQTNAATVISDGLSR
jgi:hypothetical protein